MAKGETRPGPLLISFSTSVSVMYRPPMPVANGAHGLADGVVCSCAGRNRAVVFTLEAEAHGQVRGDDIGNQLGDGEGRDAAGAFIDKLFNLGLGDVQTADARTVDDTGAVRIEGTRSQTGLIARGWRRARRGRGLY